MRKRLTGEMQRAGDENGRWPSASFGECFAKTRGDPRCVTKIDKYLLELNRARRAFGSNFREQNRIADRCERPANFSQIFIRKDREN